MTSVGEVDDFDGPRTAGAKRRRTLLRRPEFYLLYLPFYFFTWLFERPELVDLIVAGLALAVFIPVYFHGFEKGSPRYIGHILFMEALAFATTPFAGNAGTFHIYAACQAGFQRPPRHAAVLIVGLTVAWLTFSFAMGAHWMEIFLPVAVGAITGVMCIASADEIERASVRERSRALEREFAAVAERERIARDIHDLLGHTLTMTAVKAELAGKLVDADPARAKREIGDIRQAARLALKDVRAAIAGMNITTVETEVARAHDALAAAGVAFDVIGAPPALPDRLSQAAGLAIREAVTNIVRHARAGKATLTFENQGEGFVATIADDGVGGDFGDGLGLKGLRKRIEALGGVADIEGGRDGARVTFRLPIIERTP